MPCKPFDVKELELTGWAFVVFFLQTEALVAM
jgi:hypothetical protein